MNWASARGRTTAPAVATAAPPPAPLLVMAALRFRSAPGRRAVLPVRRRSSSPASEEADDDVRARVGAHADRCADGTRGSASTAQFRVEPCGLTREVVAFG